MERSFDAVLFDWCGTLVEYPLDEDRFRPVLQRLGRPHDDAAVGVLVAAYRKAARHPDAVEADERCDLSAQDHFDSLGPIDHIAGFALSCEVGTTKPDPRVFQAALDLVDVPAERCLMVGDNPRPDTGAAALGIATLILPLQRAPRPPLPERVLSLVFSEH